MSEPRDGAELAYRVAERLKADAPWELVGERATRYEVHLQGSQIEVERGPLVIEGYGLRLLRPRGEVIGTGFQASTDLSPKGIEAVVRDAEATARHSEFPAKTVQLPHDASSAREVPILDPSLKTEPAQAVRSYVDALLRPFEGRKGVVPSFGSVKATLSEISFANSAGLRYRYAGTHVDLELAVKAFGGPEGAPPGEFWVNESSRRLATEQLPAAVDRWCQYAQDVRRAKNPPGGEQAVILPPDSLPGILGPVLGLRFTGFARLRKVAPEIGSQVGVEAVTISDEGDYPWSPGSAPVDKEGTPHTRHPLVKNGVVQGLLYDALYASAFSTQSTGNAVRSAMGPSGAFAFAHAPSPGSSTLVMAPGKGGTVEELAETAGEGILVTQLAWAFPDPVSGTFGGEVRIGYRIHGGKIAEPVRGGTVGGTVMSAPGAATILSRAEALGSKAELVDRLVAPPILVRPLTVAGA